MPLPGNVKPSPLVVRESPWIHVFLAILFLVMFGAGLLTLRQPAGNAPPEFRWFRYLALLAVLPALHHVRKVFFRQPVLQANDAGIAWRKKLLCDWTQFISADIAEADGHMPGAPEKDILTILYYHRDEQVPYGIELELPNTLDHNNAAILHALQQWALWARAGG